MGFRRVVGNWERLGRLYLLLLIAAYGTYAAAFWPAVMSNDSIETWGEAEAGVFSRAHSVLYNILARLLTRQWHSPAPIVLAQVGVMVFSLAWSLRELVARGGSRRLAWVSAVALAVLPAHAVLAISVWPDAFFSSAVLVFAVLIIRLLVDTSAPALRFGKVAPMVIMGTLVALLRPNGPPVPLLTLFAVLVFIKHLRRFAAVSLAATLAMFLLIDRPLYQLIGVRPATAGSGIFNPLALQLAAHTVAGTPVAEEDKPFLSKVYPNLPWPYDCTSGMVTGFNHDFKGDAFRENAGAALSTWWHFTRQAPMVNVRHQLCLNGFIWKVTPTPMYLFAFSFNEDVPWTQQVGHTPPWEAAPVEHGWAAPWRAIEGVLRWSTTDGARPFAWAPGSYLYLLLTVTVVVAARNRQPRLLLAPLPVLANTLVIAAFTGTMEYRYLESTAMLALVMLPMLTYRAPLARASGGAA